MGSKCSSCPINRKRKSNLLDKSLNWGIRIVLAAILLIAAYEQFAKAPVNNNCELKLTSK